MPAKTASRAAEPLLPVELGAGKIKFAQGVKAGRWVFATGLMGQDFVNGIAPDVLRRAHATCGPAQAGEGSRAPVCRTSMLCCARPAPTEPIWFAPTSTTRR